MNPGYIVFIVIYCATLFLYFITETSGKMKLRAPNKIALAIMFTVFAFVGFFTGPLIAQRGYTTTSFQMLFLLGIIFAALGDVFLLFSFGRGLDFFFAGNIVFIAYEMVLLTTFGKNIDTWWWVLLVVAILVSVLIFLAEKFPKFFKLGDKKKVAIMYFVSIALHGITGVAVMAYCPGYLLLGLGSFLFMLSDVAITFHFFVWPESKWVLRLNSCLYFIGLLLMVLSTVIIC